jgi:hypothetical protein
VNVGGPGRDWIGGLTRCSSPRIYGKKVRSMALLVLHITSHVTEHDIT